MNIDGFGRVALRSRRTAAFCPISTVYRHKALLLVGVAAAALAGATGAQAGDVKWINTDTTEILWENGVNWDTGAAPATVDTVTIGSGGTANLYTHTTVDTLNLESGTLWINRNAELNVGTVNVSGGLLGLVLGHLTHKKNPGPQGIINVSTLLDITGGTVERFGLIEVGAAGTVTQSGGAVLDPVQINTPRYELTGGIVGSQNIAATTMLQAGGEMNGTVAGTSYEQTGGTLNGRVEFSELFELSDEGEIVWGAMLVGDSEAVFEQSGGTMGSIVHSGAFVDDEGPEAGIDTYRQSGGDMTGWVTTGTYEASGGTVNSTVDFSELFALSGDAIVGDVYLNGDGDAAMTQSGTSVMGGDVSGIATYTMSGGTITDTGTVSFAEHFAFSGGEINFVDILGSAEATMTQSGGTMAGAVWSLDTDDYTIAKYTQTGGDMTSDYVYARDYAMSGGTLSGNVLFTDTFELVDGVVSGPEDRSIDGLQSGKVIQSGGSMATSVVHVLNYDQSGGAMTNFVATDSYDLSGGSVSGQVNFVNQFTLSDDGEVVADATLSSYGAGQMVQSGGTMSGNVNAITTYTQSGGGMDGQADATAYTQSGGTMSGEANTENYTLSAGTLSGEATFGTEFALSGTGEVTSAATLTGDGSATATQSGGTMSGAVSSITGYTQTGGAMAGEVTATTYTMSGGTLTGEAAGFTNFLLSGDNVDVVVSGTLVGASGSIVTQTGGLVTGNVSGVTDYLQGGRVGSTAVISFSQLYALSNGYQLDAGAQIIGGAGSVMTQATDKSKMEGTVTGISSYTQSAGKMTGSVSTDSYAVSNGIVTGTVNFSDAFTLGTADAPQSGQINGSAMLVGGAGSTMTQSGGSMKGTVSGIASYTQTAGTMGGKVTTGSYELSGGELSGDVTFSTLFALSGDGALTSTAELTQTGGSMNSTLSGIASYTQTGGTMSGAVTALSYDHVGGSMAGIIEVGTYSLTEAGTSAGTITASSAFNLGFDGDTATVDAKLSGTGNLVKSGTSTVVLANDANDFTGTVAVDGGVLEVEDSALSNGATVTVADAATLRFNTGAGVSTVFDGIMSGSNGVLEKTGFGTLTLGGDIYLGALQVSGGVLNIGNGAPEEASFDYAYIAEGATLYVASGATLRVRIPKNIANYGSLINDGTVYDDLENGGMFVNNADYVAQVASNTGDIANNADGVWTGDVMTNNSWINNNDDAIWNGDVVTNGAPGINGKIGRVANAGGIWTGDILSNNGHIINDNIADESDIGYWIGDVVSNNDWIFNGGGGDWTGDVRSNGGLVMNDGLAVWNGDVLANASLVWNGGDWNGDVVGNANNIHNAGGTWTGDVKANTGTIANTQGIRLDLPTADSTWIGDVVTNGGTINNGVGSTWEGDVLGNSGSIRTLGLWTGNFNNAGMVWAEGQIVGTFANTGVLKVTGDLDGITTLTNTGKIDMTGAGPQQLSVGSASFSGASFLDMQIDPNGASDQIAVTGLATLGGTLRISDGGDPHTDGPFTILTAGTVDGKFDTVIIDLAFFAPKLSYDMHSVSVDLLRNEVSFGEVGTTDNQIAVGTAIGELGTGNALYDAVLRLSEAEVQSAFDQLSGEPHASQASGAIENSSGTGQIAINRVEQAFAALDEGAEQVSGYAQTASLADGMPSSNAVWGQLYGAYGIVDAASGAAGVDAYNSGIVAGLDGLVGDWRLGVLLQGGFSDTQVSALNASASSTDLGLGLYGGRQFGDTLLSFGATYTRHDNSTTRQVSFSDFTDTLNASYASGTSQVFGNVSHEFDFGAISLKPHAGLAYISHATEGFTESGGPAALTSAASVVNATIASLGLGAEQQFLVGEDMLLTANASLGWRHAFADAPIFIHQFDAGPAFNITGQPVASDVLTLGAGLALDVGGGTNIDLTYGGQIGSGTQTHAVQGAWSQRF